MSLSNSTVFARPGVPEGQARIAQRFSVGSGPPHNQVPKGRLMLPVKAVGLSRPFGTWLASPPIPTLKRWAIVKMSLRDGASATFPKGILTCGTWPRHAHQVEQSLELVHPPTSAGWTHGARPPPRYHERRSNGMSAPPRLGLLQTEPLL